MTKKITLESLIKKKLELKENANRKASGSLFIPSLDGEVEYEVYKSDIVDFKNSNTQDEEEAEKAVNTLIYTMIKNPDLSDKALQKELGCEEPIDIVSLIFTEGERIDLMNIALEKTGFQAGVIKEVKN